VGSSGVNISNGGTVTAITRIAGGTGYTVAPTVTISAPTTSGGVQATATCTVTAGVVNTTFTITNAGSGYVEQPTITFTPVSGGSGATAYATVGGDTTIKSLGTNLLLNAVNGTVAQFQDSASTVHWYQFNASSGSTGTLVQRIAGSGTNGSMLFVTKGSGAHQFATGNTTTNIQLQVSPTASVVNYVQVTGAATGNSPTISAQGSDANIDLTLTPKGTGRVKTATAIQARLDPKVVSTGTASSLTPDVATAEIYSYTALASALTINAPTGTPVDGNKLMFRLLDNGTARALTWNATYTVVGVTLPTTTTANKTTYVGCIYNANNTRWDVIAVATQA
jgi:hypothetical protein